MTENQSPAVQAAIAAAQAAHQQYRAAEADLARLSGLIGKEEQKIERMQAARPDIAAMKTMLEDMAAAQVLGTTTAAEVRKVEEEYRQAEDLAAGLKPQIERCRSVVAGLTREKQKVADRLVSQIGKRSSCLRVLVKALAEQVGAQYVEAARQVRRDYVRLAGLQALASHLQAVDIFDGDVRLRDVQIPAFGLEAFNGARLPAAHADFTVHTGVTMNAMTRLNAAREELAALAGSGIELSWEEVVAPPRGEPEFNLS